MPLLLSSELLVLEARPESHQPEAPGVTQGWGSPLREEAGEQSGRRREKPLSAPSWASSFAAWAWLERKHSAGQGDIFLTPPLGAQQGRNSSTPPKTRGQRIKLCSFHLPPGPVPGLMIIKQSLIPLGLARQLPETTAEEVIKYSCWASVGAFGGQHPRGKAGKEGIGSIKASASLPRGAREEA